MKNIAKGERVREYAIDVTVDREWAEICRGFSIGHKRIERFEPIKTSQVSIPLCQVDS